MKPWIGLCLVITCVFLAARIATKSVLGRWRTDPEKSEASSSPSSGKSTLLASASRAPLQRDETHVPRKNVPEDNRDCKLDINKVSDDLLAQSSLGSKAGLAAVLEKSPIQSSALHKAIRDELAPVKLNIQRCFQARPEVPSSKVTLKIHWHLSSSPSAFALTNAALIDIQGDEAAVQIARQCVHEHVADRRIAKDSGGISYVEYSGPYPLTIALRR